MAKTRFSKAGMVADLRARSEHIARLHGFHNQTGTAQLRITEHSNRAKKIADYSVIDQTVWYGRWRELLTLADWIENGVFGDGRM